jgi:hypothetical protein
MAVLSIADGTQKTGAADQERTSTIAEAQVGVAQMADDLRNACLMFGAGGSAGADVYCRKTFTQPLGTSACTRSSDCVDFIRATRRQSGGLALVRVRTDCGAADPASASQTECARYAVACTAASCPSPTALTGVLVRSVTNGGATGSPTNVFVYCTRETLSSAAGAPGCSATPATAGAIQISVAVARRGQRKTGGAGAFLLQDGAELKNINEDNS